MPVLILSMKESNKKKRPAIVFLHSTHKCKEWLRPLLEAYASRGYIAVAIDSRYHGERASSMTTYRNALVSSWKTGDTMPFIYDTVWDLIKLADYLTEREDVDPSRIGITGESLGGMHAWFGAAVDTRYTVVVPIIGVQGFRWAIEHDKWQARVNSIKAVFEEAQADLGKKEIDKDVVEKVWDRIAPGLASQFDSPYTVPVISPRPLLILNGEEDPRCPLAGLEIPKSKATQSCEDAHCPDHFKVQSLLLPYFTLFILSSLPPPPPTTPTHPAFPECITHVMFIFIYLFIFMFLISADCVTWNRAPAREAVSSAASVPSSFSAFVFLECRDEKI
nr:putative esterase YitV [Ipomoea batatas]